MLQQGCCCDTMHLALFVHEDVFAADPGHGPPVRNLISGHRRQRACAAWCALCADSHRKTTLPGRVTPKQDSPLDGLANMCSSAAGRT